MKTKVLILILVSQFFFMQVAAFGSALEITTGSNPEEGIKGHDGGWLKNKNLVQIIKAPDGRIKEPDASGKPTAPNELISQTEIGYNFPFNRDQGKFDFQAWANGSDKIFIRAWDGKYYGDSEVYTVGGADGEIWDIGGDENKASFVTSKRITEPK